jgi:hypothetical protein
MRSRADEMRRRDARMPTTRTADDAVRSRHTLLSLEQVIDRIEDLVGPGRMGTTADKVWAVGRP